MGISTKEHILKIKNEKENLNRYASSINFYDRNLYSLCK